MQKPQQWPFSKLRNFPYAFSYIPDLLPPQQDFLNPYLGYPTCPLIGRYNQGEYRIAQTKAHFQFHCLYDQKSDSYKCGSNTISIPYKIVLNLRNIPEVIKHNKAPGQNNPKIQDVHPIKFPVRDDLKFTFIITFGQIGKDFLNYLNHMYTLAQDLFIDEKLRRSVFMLPIYAHLPFKSGILQEEVDKGLNLQNYRSEFMSLHLKWGSPAFSPNNMRLGIEGMKKVVSQQNPPGNRKKKQEYKEKNQGNLEGFLNKKQNKENAQNGANKISEAVEIEANLFEDDDLFEENKKVENTKKQEPKKGNETKQTNKKGEQTQTQHKGFLHFYTSMLMEKDYRVYYHWHIDNLTRRQLVETILEKSNSLIEFLERSKELLGNEDECVMEAMKIFGLKGE